MEEQKCLPAPDVEQASVSMSFFDPPWNNPFPNAMEEMTILNVEPNTDVDIKEIEGDSKTAVQKMEDNKLFFSLLPEAQVSLQNSVCFFALFVTVK